MGQLNPPLADPERMDSGKGASGMPSSGCREDFTGRDGGGHFRRRPAKNPGISLRDGPSLLAS